MGIPRHSLYGADFSNMDLSVLGVENITNSTKIPCRSDMSLILCGFYTETVLANCMQISPIECG